MLETANNDFPSKPPFPGNGKGNSKCQWEGKFEACIPGNHGKWEFPLTPGLSTMMIKMILMMETLNTCVTEKGEVQLQLREKKREAPKTCSNRHTSATGNLAVVTMMRTMTMMVTMMRTMTMVIKDTTDPRREYVRRKAAGRKNIGKSRQPHRANCIIVESVQPNTWQPPLS